MWPFSNPYPATSPHSIASQQFDYIVVGGGTAGCVIASRLSERRDATVLLLESGPVLNTWISRVPLLSSDFRHDTSPVYKWAAAPLAVIKDLGAISFRMVSGRVLGGSSKINMHLYTRSVPGEYNSWAQAGRKGWTWEEVEPFFNKSEKSLSHGKLPYRGAEGPWHNQRIDDIPFQNIRETINACTDLGISCAEVANDPNAPAVSCVRMDHTIDENSRRQSAFDAFLPPHVWQRPNLAVCTGVVVESIAFEETPEGPRAAGVRFSYEDSGKAPENFYVPVRHEVIVSGGAIGSPQVLMLSGIGPVEHLKSHGIEVVKDLPGVGSHLQDHIGVSVNFKVPRVDTLHDIETNPWLGFKELVRYLLTGSGLFLSPLPQCAIFARSALINEDGHVVTDGPSDLNAHDPTNIPDFEIMPIPYMTGWTELETLGLTSAEAVTSYLCALLRPESKGTVRLTSRDPRARPACDLNILSEPADYAVLRRSLRLALSLARTVRARGYVLKDLIVPASSADVDLDAHINAHCQTTYHYSSTCRMAPEAELGVVDDELRVHGVRGLRVADASVFPTIPACHLQAPVVMVGERCADFVLHARERL